MTAAKPVQPFRLKLHQKVPMRDGVNLSADIYLPHGEKRYPTLLLRTIYHSKEPRYIRWVVGFVKAGYAIVIQDTRGRHDSDGTWEPYTCEIPDGFDTHEWIGRQPWSDGKIGTFGISYPGFTQTCPAPDGSKHLAALVPIASQQDNFGHHRCDGLIAWANTVFFPNMVGRTMQSEAIATLDLQAIQNHLPLHNVWDDITDSPYVRGVVEHEDYGPYWSSYSLRHRYDKVDVPSYFMTGWYDSLLNETIKVFQGWKKKARSPEARKLTKIIIGPWGHQVAPWGKLTPDFHLGPNGKFQDMDCGPDAEGDIVQMHLRWYDARMKGAKNGMDEEPALNLFIQGENAWRLEDQWPLKKTRWTDYYLHASGKLDTARPAGSEAPDKYRYDPKDPVPTWGGSYQMKELCGPRDRREIEKRKDVICYTTEPLAQDVEVTGPVTATIWASSSALDTDFTASLIDVYPDGRALLLTDGICRARFRKAADGWKPEDLEKGIAPYERLYEPGFKPEMLTPNTPTEFKIDLWSTANLFKKGHRIRVEISSSNFPRYDRNMNTGGRVGFEAEGKIADQVIHHDADKPSRITLPVIPR